jgi:hypothetical protein
MALLPNYFTIQIAFAPLPQPFMKALREIEIETAIGQASIFRLHFDLSRNFMGDFDALAIDIFRPLFPIMIRMSGIFGIPQTLINGYIKDAQISALNDPGRSTLEVAGMDALGTVMALIEQPMPWINMSDSMIAELVFLKYGIIATAFPTAPTRTVLDTVTTQRGNDSEFLQQLVERNGFVLYIQPDPVAGFDLGHFHPPISPIWPQSALPQGVLSVDFGKQTNLFNFKVSNDMLRPTSVLTASSEPRTRVPIPAVAPVSTDLPMGLEPTLNRILPPPIERSYGTDAANPAEVQIQALARATKSSRSIRASGEVDGLKYTRALMVGMPVLVRGAGRQYSGLYHLDSVTHRISRDNYTQNFTAWRNAVGLTGGEIFIDPLSAVA